MREPLCFDNWQTNGGMMKKAVLALLTCVVAVFVWYYVFLNAEPASTAREKLFNAVESRNLKSVRKLAIQLADEEGPVAIPLLIGVIDADNSYDTVYGVGYFALWPLTGVEYAVFHDGAWWRRWWAKNKSRFSEEAQRTQIPDLRETRHGRKYQPFPASLDTLQGKLAFLSGLLKRAAPENGISKDLVWSFAGEVARHDDPHAVPYLIGLIQEENAYFTIYGIGSFGLGRLTGVEYSPNHDGKWWREWWEDNKSEYPADVQAIEIPDYRAPLVFSWKEPTAEERERAAEKKGLAAMADVADVPVLDLTLAGNEKMRYFLIGPWEDAAPPERGFRLVVVMPGGSGGEAFHPFVRRLYKRAMDRTFLVAEPVAFKWHVTQRTVWPTRVNPVARQQFSTEDYIEAVIEDVKRRHPVDERCIFTLSWSSSGPAAYAIALERETAVTGSYIAMSVYRPEWHPPVGRAKGRIFLIEHSPQDKICPFSHAQKAERELLQLGATVRLVTYEGGHGWRGPVYDRVREGLSWLVRETEQGP